MSHHHHFRRLGVAIAIFLLPFIAHSQSTTGKSVIAGGGSTVVTSEFVVNVTLAQPVIGKSGSTHNAVSSGFWIPYRSARLDIAQSTAISDRNSRLSIGENPFRDHTTIWVQTEGNGGVLAMLFDNLGRTVQTLPTQSNGDGSFTVSIDGTPLTAGLYIILITHGDKQHAVRLIHIE